MKIEVSVVVATLHRKDSLLRLLWSLSQEITESCEIIVVEQGENHGKEILSGAKKLNLKVQYIFTDTLGVAKARNVGVGKARGEILLFFDDDVVVHKGVIKRHVSSYKDKYIGAVTGRVITPGQAIESHRTDVGRITFFGRFTDGFSSEIRQEVDTVITCNSSFRKFAFEKVGGFDEQFGGAIREDSDLSLRIKKAGYKILFEPEAVVDHLREQTGGGRKSEGRLQWYRNFFCNETYFFLKHRPAVVVPIILLTRIEWALRCMFGFGRTVNLTSILVPIRGIMDGIEKYRKYIYDNRR